MKITFVSILSGLWNTKNSFGKYVNSSRLDAKKNPLKSMAVTVIKNESVSSANMAMTMKCRFRPGCTWKVYHITFIKKDLLSLSKVKSYWFSDKLWFFMVLVLLFILFNAFLLIELFKMKKFFFCVSMGFGL